MIKINNLSKVYGKLEVLKGINLNISTGQVFGIVGRNGAGKTTFFDCLAGVTSHEGSITYHGNRLKDVTGYLNTRPHMMTYITGYEYLQLIANARKAVLPDWDTINLFDLPLDRYASSYSTGMQKKLALTGLLFLKNSIYLFDEPYNGLDLEGNIMLAAIIKRLKSRGYTIIISSHILETLTQSCDQIAHLEDGVIADTYGPESFSKLRTLFDQGDDLSRIEKIQF